MALPSGYKRVEYIQSSGSQYVDTGFKPNQDTRVVMDVDVDTTTSQRALFGCRTAYANNAFCLWTGTGNAGYQTDYGSLVGQPTSPNSTGRHLLDKNKNVLTVDGTVVVSQDAAAFQTAYNLFLLQINNGGSVMSAYPFSGKLYSCKIYDNGTLVRDFIPAITDSNEVGLWDDVNTVFYGNAGNGTFTAGPVLEPPKTPVKFETTLAVYLRWGAVSDASGYRVYRDGSLIGDTSETYYVDTAAESNQTYTYALAAYNDGGESDAVELVVYTRTGYFIIKPLVTSATFQ